MQVVRTERWAMVAELAKVFTGGTFDECAFPEGMTTG